MDTSERSGVWKSVALFLAGIILSQGISWLTYVKNAVTEDRVITLIDAKVGTDSGIQVKLDDLIVRNQEMKEQMRDIQTKVIQLSMSGKPDNKQR